MKYLWAILFVLTMAVTVFGQDSTPDVTENQAVVVTAEATAPVEDTGATDVTVEDGGTVIINEDEPDPTKEPWEIALGKFFLLLGGALVALRMGIKGLIEVVERLSKNTFATSIAEQVAERVKALTPEPLKEQARETKEDAERLRTAVENYLEELFDGQPLLLKQIQEAKTVKPVQLPPDEPQG